MNIVFIFKNCYVTIVRKKGDGTVSDTKEYVTMSDEGGTINISEEVLGIISVEAIGQVEGVGGITNTLGRDIAELFGKKNAFKGVKISMDGAKITIDTYILVKYGYPVNDVAVKVQRSVADAVESMTALTINEVNVHVSGIVFEK